MEITTENTEGTEVFGNNSLTESIIGTAIEVHRELGSGLLESVYEKCLAFELADRGFRVSVQQEIPVRYKGLVFECAFRADLLVNETVLIELKAIDLILPVHTSQVLTYLKLASLKTGLLINFNVPLLKQGIKRVSL